MQDLKERLTEGLRTGRYWVPVTDLRPGMRLEHHGEIKRVEFSGDRAYVTIEGGQMLPYMTDEKALLALPQTANGR